MPKPHTQAVNYYSKYKYFWQGIQKNLMMRYPQALNIEQICVPRSMICPVQIFYCCITWHDIYAAAVNLICKLFCLLLFHFWQFLHIWYLVYFVLIAFPCHPRQMSKVNFPRYKLLWIATQISIISIQFKDEVFVHIWYVISIIFLIAYFYLVITTILADDHL